MSKRSDSIGMEFLITYGWAILLVLVAIGALAYFGVLNQDNFITNRCFCNYADMDYSMRIIENNITYKECYKTEYFLNDDKTRIEQQITYSIFYCSENKTLIPVR